MLPLLYSILDYDRSPASFERYDKMSAWDLFQRLVIAPADCHSVVMACLSMQCFVSETSLVSLQGLPTQLHNW